MIFKASRLSDGNKMFPIEIEIKETSVEIKDPGFFESNEMNYDYQQISNLRAQDPMLGYCTISFDYEGKNIKVHGFTEEDKEEIMRLIDLKKKEYLSRSSSR